MALNPSPQVPKLSRLANGNLASVVPDAGGGEPPPGGDATLLFIEDFESTLKAGGQLQNGCEIVTNQPFAGTRCVRSNLKASATDPFIAVPANDGSYFYNGSELSVATAPSIYTIRIHYRVDDATWEGDRFIADHPAQISAKGGWYGPRGDNVQKGFYTVLRGGSNGGIRFGDNQDAGNQRGDFGWQDSESWAIGRTIFYLGTGEVWGAGTGWFTVDMVIDTTPAAYNRVRLKVDGVVATASYAPDGWMNVPKTWWVEDFNTIYTNWDDVNLSVDRTETACGVQVDNIEIYSGEPS